MALIPKNNGASRRFVAVLCDGIIIQLLTIPLGLLTGIIIGLAGVEETSGDLIITLASTLISYGVIFFYYAWFYKNKGATPGKLLMNLQVIDLQSGGRLGYGRTFLREFIGKFIAAIILLIGFIMIIFRKDKRGLHDLIANTSVVYTGPEA